MITPHKRKRVDSECPNCWELPGTVYTKKMINRLSDNVGGVKRFSSTLRHALREERHFALVEKVPHPTKARIVIVSGQEARSDPSISSISTAIMITSSDSPMRGAGCPINISMFYCTP
jgi:hypothetical protein